MPWITFTSEKSAHVTHLVCPRKGNDIQRTMKVLLALARWSYIVTEDWLEKLLGSSANSSPDASFFEVEKFPKKMERIGIKRLLEGTSFILHKNFFEPDSIPNSDEIRLLVELVGGSFSEPKSSEKLYLLLPKDFSPSKNSKIDHPEAKAGALRINWLFDSIQNCRLMETDPYIVQLEVGG